MASEKKSFVYFNFNELFQFCWIDGEYTFILEIEGTLFIFNGTDSYYIQVYKYETIIIAIKDALYEKLRKQIIFYLWEIQGIYESSSICS